MNSKMEKKLRFEDIIILIYLTIPVFNNSTQQYLFAFSIMMLSILVRKKYKILIRSPLEKLPLVFIAVWLSGFIVGIVRENNTQYIIRNFAGMLLYSAYYFFSSFPKESVSKLIKIIYLASMISSVECIIAVILYRNAMTVPWPLSNLPYNKWTESGGISYICVLPFVLEAVSLWKIIHPNHKAILFHITMFILAAFAIMFTTDSGGMRFGFAGILIIIILTALRPRKKTLLYLFASICISLLIIVIMIAYENKMGFIREIFSYYSSGNNKRIAQFGEVFRRFKIFGNGLGSEFDYRVGAMQYKTYAIEVTYLNLIDKFGLFSIPLIYYFIQSYVLPILAIIKRKGNDICNVVCIGLLGYLFVGAGNPVIFAPYNVFLHMLAIYLVTMGNRMDAYEEKRKADRR